MVFLRLLAAFQIVVLSILSDTEISQVYALSHDPRLATDIHKTQCSYGVSVVLGAYLMGASAELGTDQLHLVLCVDSSRKLNQLPKFVESGQSRMRSSIAR